MSILYRTPNIVIDEFEFHIAVELRAGRVRRHTRYRPLSDKDEMWRSIADFEGYPPKPRIMATRFAPFKHHMVQAERSVTENRIVARELVARRKARFVERAMA
jgi:hypothetical protein